MLNAHDGELHIQTMMKDQYANYVVQKIIDISNEKQKERLLECIQLHIVALKKYTYGKHIVARFEQLSGEGMNGSPALLPPLSPPRPTLVA